MNPVDQVVADTSISIEHIKLDDDGVNAMSGVDDGKNTKDTSVTDRITTEKDSSQQQQHQPQPKTPMCYINELARFNKVHLQYILQNEIGPAHKKTFYVQLKLGDTEEYTALGTSIKKAQQAAAQLALDKTQLPKPQKDMNAGDKRQMVNRLSPNKTFTPTVRLNALAMKLGYEPYYLFVDNHHRYYQNGNRRFMNSSELPSMYMYNSFGYSNFNMKMSRLNLDNNKNVVKQQNGGGVAATNGVDLQQTETVTTNTTFNPIPALTSTTAVQSFYLNQLMQQQMPTVESYTCALQIANQTYYGVGVTRQAAKHNAAMKAIQYLEKFNVHQEQRGNRVRKKPAAAMVKQNNDEDKPTGPTTTDPTPATSTQVDTTTSTITTTTTTTTTATNKVPNQKSEITILQEIASIRKISLDYELVQESGPSHIKKYTTKCQFGEHETIGEGKSKKESKLNCAANMLQELDNLKLIDLKSLIKPKITKPQEQVNNNEAIVQETDAQATMSTVTDKSQSNKQQQNKRKAYQRRKPKNIVHSSKALPDYGLGSINPISRLMQIQQLKKWPEPIYELLEEKVTFRKHEFVMQVSVGATGDSLVKCTGVAGSKRLAKQYAAENMLSFLGFAKTAPFQPKPVLKPTITTVSAKGEQQQTNPNRNLNEKKVVKFVGLPPVESDANNNNQNGDSQTQSVWANPVNKSSSNQKHRNSTLSSQFKKLEFNNRHGKSQQKTTSQSNDQSSTLASISPHHQQQYNEAMALISAIASELLTKGYSQTGEMTLKQKAVTTVTTDTAPVVMLKEDSDFKDKLGYLSEVMNFQVNYRSLGKKDDGISSYVEISILPQSERPFSGNGKTSNESCNMAALSALTHLAELRLKSPPLCLTPPPPPLQPASTAAGTVNSAAIQQDLQL